MTRKTILRNAASVGLIASCLAVLGCHSPSAVRSNDTTNTPIQVPVNESEAGRVTVSNGIRIVHAEWADIGYRWEWATTPFYRGKGKIAFIDPIGDRVAVQSKDAWTSIVGSTTGNVLWQVSNSSPLTGFIGNVRVGNTLLSCARPELFLMDINSGNLIARQPVEVVITTRPVILGGYAIFGTPTGEIICHRFGDGRGNPLPPPLDDGMQIWGYLLDGAVNADPVKIGGLAGIVSDVGEIFFVDILTGSGRGLAHISGGMATNPVTDGKQMMFVASLDQSIYAFVPESNTYLWRYRTASPLRIQPTYHDGVLYCSVPGEGLIAFDVSDDAIQTGRFGRKLWVNKDILGEVIAVESGELILWDGSTVARIDQKRGDVLAMTSLPGIIDLVPSEFVDGDMYAVGNNGQLFKFGPR